MKLTPLKNYVMFRFLDTTSGSKGKFVDRTTKGGIILPILDSSQKLPRWGEVVAAGPQCTVKPGDFILIEALMWSFGTTSTFDGSKIWKTDEDKIIMTADTAEDTYETSFE